MLFEAWLQPAPALAQLGEPSDETVLWNDLVRRAIQPVLPPARQRRQCGFILATTKGDIGRLETWLSAVDANGDGERLRGLPPTAPSAACQTPTAGPSMVPLLSQSVGTLADQFKLGGPRFCVSTACASGLAGLIEAAMMVQAGEAPRMLVCGADIAGGFVRAGFAALKAISATACRPFDKHRDGLALGSAAAAGLVEPAPVMPRRGTNPAIVLAGWAVATDAVHLTAPDRQAGGLIRAIQGALAMAGIEPGQVDAVLLHGTGTPYNDAMEATAMRRLFTHQPPLTAVKGLIGHTLGASGLIETALAARMLQRQLVPPVTGLRESQFPDLRWVQGRPLRRPLRHVLKTASGFGGLNAAVVLAALR